MTHLNLQSLKWRIAYNKLITDLMSKCINQKMGALLHNINTCIIVYADDILLISPNDYQLQKLLDICGTYGEMWRIKFNLLKSNKSKDYVPNSNCVPNRIWHTIL